MLTKCMVSLLRKEHIMPDSMKKVEVNTQLSRISLKSKLVDALSPQSVCEIDEIWQTEGDITWFEAFAKWYLALK